MIQMDVQTVKRKRWHYLTC